MSLTRDQLLAASARVLSLETAEVEVPELGGSVRLRALSNGEREDFAIFATKLESEHAQLEAYLLSMRELVRLSLVDANGDLMFGKEDADAIKALPPESYAKLRQRAQELNNLVRKEEQGATDPLPASAET